MRPRRIRLTKDEDGYVRVEVSVSNPLDPKLKAKVTFIADTGASGCTIPQEVAEKLNLEPRGEANVVLADGRVTTARFGTALLEIQGRRLYAYVIYGPGFDALLGIDVMRDLDIHVDPRTRSLLIPIRFLRPLRYIFNLRC
jgi:clan AA aspartic protease